MLTRSIHRLSSTLLLSLASVLPVSATPENLMATVKFPPLKTFSDKVMTVARTIEPGQQTEMLPMIMLSPIGYPNYPGVSASDPVVLFVFKNDNQLPGTPPPAVILVNTTPDSQLSQALPMFELQFLRKGDWLIIAKDPQSFAFAKDLDALIAIANEKAQFDVEGRFYLGKEKINTWINGFKTVITQKYESEDDRPAIELDRILRFVNLAESVLENLDWAEFGINITPNAIEFGKVIQASTGSPEGKLFSSPAGGDVTAATFLSADAPIVYYGKLNYPALLAYYNILSQRAHGMIGPKGKEILDQLDSVMKISLEEGDGTVAGKVVGSGIAASTTSISGGKYTDESLLIILNTSYQKIVPQVVEALTDTEFDIDDVDFTYTPNFATHNGVAIHQSQVELDLDQEDLQALPPAFLELQKQNYYYAAVSGYIVQASSLEEIQNHIDVIKAGKPLPNNLRTALTPVSGAALQYRYDIVNQIVGTYSEMVELAPDGSPLVTILEQLKETNFEPATGYVSHANNQLKATISFPLSTLAGLYQATKQLQASLTLEDESVEIEVDSM